MDPIKILLAVAFSLTAFANPLPSGVNTQLFNVMVMGQYDSFLSDLVSNEEYSVVRDDQGMIRGVMHNDEVALQFVYCDSGDDYYVDPARDCPWSEVQDHPVLRAYYIGKAPHGIETLLHNPSSTEVELLKQVKDQVELHSLTQFIVQSDSSAVEGKSGKNMVFVQPETQSERIYQDIKSAYLSKKRVKVAKFINQGPLDLKAVRELQDRPMEQAAVKLNENNLQVAKTSKENQIEPMRTVVVAPGSQTEDEKVSPSGKKDHSESVSKVDSTPVQKKKSVKNAKNAGKQTSTTSNPHCSKDIPKEYKPVEPVTSNEVPTGYEAVEPKESAYPTVEPPAKAECESGKPLSKEKSTSPAENENDKEVDENSSAMKTPESNYASHPIPMGGWIFALSLLALF